MSNCLHEPRACRSLGAKGRTDHNARHAHTLSQPRFKPESRRGASVLSVRGVVQRVSKARVLVDGRSTGEIGLGLVVLLGVAKGDTSAAARYLAEKTATVRIFADEAGKMNLSLLDIRGAALVVSQFTLYGDTRGQGRPSFIKAASRDEANRLYEEYCAALRDLGVPVQTGIFQTMMSLELTNEGPVTILLDSEKVF